jgi:hypothetical protein
MSDNGNGNSWRNSAAVAVIIAVTTQLGFTIWWAAHLDQTTMHIIQRANALDARIEQLNSPGGVRVHELSLRAGIVDREAVLTNQKVDRLEESIRQLMLIDERVKSIQAQTATSADRIEALSRNLSNLQTQLLQGRGGR